MRQLAIRAGESNSNALEKVTICVPSTNNLVHVAPPRIIEKSL